jgi:hypothetical protein
MYVEVKGAAHRRRTMASQVLTIALSHLVPDEARLNAIVIDVIYETDEPECRLRRETDDHFILRLVSGETLAQDVVLLLMGAAEVRQWIDGDRKGLPNTVKKVRWKGETVDTDPSTVQDAVSNPLMIDTIGRATILRELLADQFDAMVRRCRDDQE